MSFQYRNSTKERLLQLRCSTTTLTQLLTTTENEDQHAALREAILKNNTAIAAIEGTQSFARLQGSLQVRPTLRSGPPFGLASGDYAPEAAQAGAPG